MKNKKSGVLSWIIIIALLIACGYFFILPKINEKDINNGWNNEIEDFGYIGFQKEIDPEVEEKMVQSVLLKYHLLVIRKSDYDNISDVFETLNEGDSICPVDDEDFITTLSYYFYAETDENGNPISKKPIETNSKNIDNVLLWSKYANEVFDGKTKASRIIEIAKEDKDVVYVATLDWIDEIPLEEVPDNTHLYGYDTNTDENGVIKCICIFVSD